MRNRYTLPVLFLVVFTFHFRARAQQDTAVLKALVTNMQKQSEQRPAEKVYLHFDKPYYAVGDTIWFKSYITANHFLSPLSKIVYVEIMNRDSTVQTLKLPVNNGMAYGNVPLLQTQFKEGNYRVRAYTKWMMNFEPEYFFNRNLVIGNALDKELSTNVSLKGNWDAKSARVNARVQYLDGNGNPLSRKRVSWSAVYDYESVAKGKATTDEQGFADIAISSNKIDDLRKSVLETAVTLDNKQNISKNFPLHTALDSTDVQFFPEGGDLIAGITSVVAFKAVAPDGLGAAVKGSVVDQTGKAVAQFSTQHAGMGRFTLQAENGNSYTAKVTFPGGNTLDYPLPKVKAAGISLSAANTNPENLLIRISANPAYLQQHKNEVHSLVAQSNGIVCYAAQTVLNDATYSARIPKDKFPSGLVQITMFSAAGVPLTERLVFIRRNGAAVSVSTDQASYASRGKVKLNIAAKNLEAQPAAGNYSVAVIDESLVPSDENAETSILSTLLLTSDLKGYIEKPNYYFNKPDEKKDADLDVLMMTQGYRRFSYADVLAGRFSQVLYLPEQSMELTGTLRMLDGMPVNKGSVRLTMPDNNVSANAETDGDGKFRFTGLVFSDSVQAVVSARGNVNYKNMMVTMDGTAFPVVGKNKNAPDELMNIDSTLKPYLKNSAMIYRTTRVLKEVVVTAKAIVKKPSHADYPALSTLSPNADHIISGDQFKGCPLLLNCLQGMAVGFTFSDNNFYVTRDMNSGGGRAPAAIFLNGMPVDVSQLNMITTDQVESVETFVRDQLGTINRMYNTSGVIVVNTKKPDQGQKVKITKEQLQELFPEKNVAKFVPQGYAQARQFYLPKYDKPRTSNDLRTTVYWNPAVVTDKTGKASFEFYNADGKGTYRAVVEGIDQDGNISRGVYRYSVK